MAIHPVDRQGYGLGRNDLYDGRLDVIASTVAAMGYLKKLDRMFEGNWLHALAGYNVGELAVVRAVEANGRSGKSTEFWDLELRDETSKYVPRFLAVLSIVMMPEYTASSLARRRRALFCNRRDRRRQRFRQPRRRIDRR